MKRGVALVFLALCCPGVARGAPPVVDYIFPAGVQRGTSTPVTFGGKVEASAKVWCDRAGVVFKPTKKAGEYTCEVAKDAEPGPCLLRVHDDEGVSAVRQFVVGELAEQLEKEPNDGFAAAMPAEQLPAVINGQLEKSGDVDGYRVTVAAGQWLVAVVQARVLGSPLDATLRILDGGGTEVAFGHDHQGLDPLVAHRAETAGEYIVQVSGFAYPPLADVRLMGSKPCVYRLTMTTGAWASHAFPAGLSRESKTPVHVHGWNLPGGAASVVREVDATKANERHSDWVPDLEGIPNRFRLAMSGVKEAVEAEPNDHAQSAQFVETPCVMNGRIGKRGDVDRFAVRARKGERFIFTCRSASLGFPMDATLRVDDSEGKPLANNDDGGDRQDSLLAWAAPADGVFHIVVSDLMRRGGEEFIYRLEIARPAPSVEATVEQAAVVVDAGGGADLTVNVLRKEGHDVPLAVVVKGLPEGVTAAAAELTKEKKTVTVRLAATKEAKAWSGEVRGLLVALDPESPMVKSVTVNLKPKEPANELLIEKSEGVWLTLRPEKKQ